MKKVLRIEVIVLLLLVVAAVCVRISFSVRKDDPPQMQTVPQATQTEATEDVMATEATEPKPTETEHWMTFPADRKLLAKQYFAYDVQEGGFLTISGEKDERIYPASITKLFTAYIAMQYIPPDQKITAGAALNLVATGSSVAKLEKGDVLTGEQLVEAMLLPSGNDAAYVLAAEAGQKIYGKEKISTDLAVQTFVKHMNEEAQRLGLTGTHFMNPDGIHKKDHYSTPADLAKIASLALKNEAILRCTRTSIDYVRLNGREVKWENTNELIRPGSEYYCPYAIGLKTGQTPYAGSCLLSAFDYHGRLLVVGVFGCPEEEDRFADTLQLFNETVGYTGSVEAGQTGSTEAGK